MSVYERSLRFVSRASVSHRREPSAPVRKVSLRGYEPRFEGNPALVTPGSDLAGLGRSDALLS